MAKKPRPQELPLDSALKKAQRPLEALWSNFAGLDGREEGTTYVAFVAADHGTGTTTVATSVALGLARNLDDKVALIEANFYTPAMASYVGIPTAPGFTDVLDGEATPEQAIRSFGVRGLSLLTAGTPRPPRQGELLGEASRSVIDHATKGRRYVVIDAPPLLEHPQSRILLDYADWVVLVVRSGTTKRARAKTALRQIEESELPVLGTVVNRFQSDMPFGIGKGEWK